MWQRDLHAQRDLAQPSPAGDDSGEVPFGPVNVYWAGNTPAGPAAVALQNVTWEYPGKAPVTVVELGLVATDQSTGVPGLVAQQTIGNFNEGQGNDSFAFGPGAEVVLTMAESGFHVYSPSPVVNPDTGKVSRQWTNLPYVDGVAVFDASKAHGDSFTVVELPARPDAGDAYLSPADQRMRYQPVAALGTSWPVTPDPDSPDPRLAWPMTIGLDGAAPGAPGTSPPSWHAVFDKALSDGGYSDAYVAPAGDPVLVPDGNPAQEGDSFWQIAVRLADGKIVVLGEELVGRLGRLYAVTVDHDGKPLSVAYGGTIDPSGELPVRYRLPDGSGWVLAAYGSHLSSGNVAGSDVLEVPPNTTTVTVTSNDGNQHTVQLGQ